MNLASILSDELLAQVEKPSRYLGTEVNAITKVDAAVRIALAFPDLYDLGLGNLGLQILYQVLNDHEDVWAERVYAPGLDMEALLRERGLPLFALESKDSLDQFDGIGFTLQSELTFTNILNILDLAGLPLRTSDRRVDDPLTFAGGPAVFNPEPLAPFMDFFVIGDGEDVVLEIADVLATHSERTERLEALAGIEGVYVPALYPMETLPDGRILPPVDGPRIRKRIARDLDGAVYPVAQVVPFTKQVHDRLSLEVLRGCTQGCRFCQAGMTTRPVRERELGSLDQLLERSLEATGYEEVSLVSLSTCDYSRPRQLVEQTVERARPERVGVSLPSLRLDSFSVELADMVAGIRRTGLTVAPEAASPRLRAVINKWIPDEKLLDMTAQAFERGWNHVKLYFMIGLPTERDDDVEAIADLTLRTLERGREWNRGARVHTGVSTFVPKPFTPFQWSAQLDLDETWRRQNILRERFRGVGGVKFGRHDPAETFLEGLVSRADRRLGDTIERAYRLGARFDAWDEHRNLDLWLQACQETGVDPAYELRERALDERLPWDHIDILMPKSWFVEDWERAKKLDHAEDCRHSRCHRCGVIDAERPLCAHMLLNSIAGRKEEKDWTWPSSMERPARVDLDLPRHQRKPPARDEQPSVQRLVLRIAVTGDARFLSHLEGVSAWLRALRRANVPLAYSQGFHPHPRMAFCCARPVGIETTGDFMDLTLKERLDPRAMVERLQATLPSGLDVLGAWEVPLGSPSLMSQVAGARYTLYLPADRERIRDALDAFMATDTWVVERRRPRKKTRRIDIRALVQGLEVLPEEQAGLVAVDLTTRVLDGTGVKPREVVKALGADALRARVLKREGWLEDGYPAPDLTRSQEDGSANEPSPE